MLKIALIVVLMATFVVPLAGIVDTTVGTVTTSWPHPATKATSKAAIKHMKTVPYLRICTLSPNCGPTVFKTRDLATS
jgi:hypothetical protein